MLAYDTIRAWGHSNIRATHRTTLEITKDETVTPRGDCIIACRANKAVADLNPQIRDILRRPDSFAILIIKAGEVQDIVLCEGSPELTLRDTRKLIIRKSRYVDDATLCIKANKAASDLDRRLINYICMGSSVEIEIIACSLTELRKLLER